MKKQIILTTVLAFMGLTFFAQERPGWVYAKPSPSNSTYLYVVESASGVTEIEARNLAFAKVLQSTAMRIGQPVNSDEINRAVQSGKSFDVISEQYNIPINKVCEYSEKSKDGFCVFILCQVANTGKTYTDFDYGFNGCYDVKVYKNSTALLLSLFMPGTGQMIKRHYIEGVSTLLAEGGLLTGALITHSEMRYWQICMEENDVHYNFYKRNMESQKVLSRSFFGAAAALYLFNIYRAYTMKPKYRNSFALVPTAIPVGSDMAYGVGFSYSF
jgi:hypothetical protein